MANIVLLLVPLFLIFNIFCLPLPARATSFCDGPCKTLNNCRGQLICINGKCNNDPDVNTHVCSVGGGGGGSSPSPSQNCKSSGTLTCRGNSYPQYRCSPPLTSGPTLGLGHLGHRLGPPTKERLPNFGAKVYIYIYIYIY